MYTRLYPSLVPHFLDSFHNKTPTPHRGLPSSLWFGGNIKSELDRTFLTIILCRSGSGMRIEGMKKYIATMSNNNNFQSLLSEFCDATATISSASVKLGNASLKPIILGTSSSSSSCSASNASSKSMDPTSTTDPSFSAPLLKERIERMMRIRQIRKSTGVIKKVGEDDCDAVDHAHSNNNQRNQNSSSVHIAVCATIVDDFPHEALWKKWMDGTGGEFSLEDGNYDLLRRLTDDNSASSPSDGYKITDKYFASAEMYVHAKNPERIQSEWLR